MIRQLLFAVAAISIGLTLAGCAATPPMPLDQYVALRDLARDHLNMVELATCPDSGGRTICANTRLLRETLKPADQTMIAGYAKGGLSDEQWAQALGIVTGVLGKALSAFLGIPGR